MLKRAEDITTNELRDFFGATKWKKFTLSIREDDPEKIQKFILGARKSIVDFSRGVYLKNRRAK